MNNSNPVTLQFTPVWDKLPPRANSYLCIEKEETAIFSLWYDGEKWLTGAPYMKGSKEFTGTVVGWAPDVVRKEVVDYLSEE